MRTAIRVCALILALCAVSALAWGDGKVKEQKAESANPAPPKRGTKKDQQPRSVSVAFSQASEDPNNKPETYFASFDATALSTVWSKIGRETR